MDVSSILNDGFDYTKKMFANIGQFIILIVLSIIPIVNFVIAGYAAKVVRETPASTEPPALKGYVELWIQGLKVVVAAVIWMIVPIVLIAIGFGFSAFMFGAWIVLGIIGGVIAFLISIIMSMALVHMIKHDRFSKAFAVEEILDMIKRVGWGKYILWLIVIFVISLILSAIASIPYVGWVIAAIIGPLYAVFTARSASLIYSEGVPTPTTPPSEAKYCKNCGESLPLEAIYCPKCGQKIE